MRKHGRSSAREITDAGRSRASGTDELTMKNQYFGDARDLFKYDLLLELVAIQGGRQLVFIPMLTPNDGTAEGNLTGYKCTTQRPLLYQHLRRALDSGRRKIT